MILGSDDVTNKSNGVNDTSTNGSSAFIPSIAVATMPIDDQEDGSLVIGSSTLPATVPLLIESTQINNNDQLEIVSSVQTKQIIEEIDDQMIKIERITTTTTTEIEIENTLQPTGETNPSNGDIAETQPYQMESEEIVTDVIETKKEELHKVVINGDEMIEKVTTITTTTMTTSTVMESENPPMQTLAYDLQSTTDNTQDYDLDEQVKKDENIIEIKITKDQIPTDIEQTQANDDMGVTQTQINNDMGLTQTQANDHMGPTQTPINDDITVTHTQANDDMGVAETQANDDMGLTQTPINDDIGLTETQANDDIAVTQTQANDRYGSDTNPSKLSSHRTCSNTC